jgi:plasmid stabilization system protein ParE
MPIQLEIFHPDRILVGIGRGSITLQEYGEFVSEIIKAGVLHYRKIIDATAAESTTIDKDVLIAFDEQLREMSKGRPRGPLALVVDPHRGDLARIFRALSSSDRPVEVFRSIHDARRWLRSLPMVE